MKWLLVLSFCFAVFGIVVLFFSKPVVEPDKLLLSGVVNGVSSDGSVVFVNLSTSLPVVSFRSLPLKVNDSVVLVGSLKSWRGRIEFVVDSVG